MDYTDVRAMIHDAIGETLSKHFTEKDCPKCGQFTTMFKFWVEANDEDKPIIEDKVRCLNCMAVFVEELKEVKE